ncbi:MAG: hypothetical protein KDD72_03415 [Anaerolineales bacterium]|nr:hypothetical protein [Anaerolineales bacterium]
MMQKTGCAFLFITILLVLGVVATAPYTPEHQAVDPSPPDHTVKLIFIHHSTGENWLADDYGDLGRTLNQNNYFVSDTNYGWGPDAIGDRTDIPNWTEWFANENTSTYMNALFNENEQHANYTRTLTDPGGENEIIMFKSCFPNSALEGNPNDPPGTYEELTVSGAKYVYNTILPYFATHPDKLFIVITAPPLSDGTYAKNARAFNNWLVNDWLRENNYTLNNVAVFDFYNILTDPNAHHRVNNGQIEHILGSHNTLYYPSGDDHPSVEGSRKATEEFVPMLNVFYNRWKENSPAPSNPDSSNGADTTPESAPLSPTSSLIAGFGNGEPLWEAFSDEFTPSTMTCQPEAGTGRTGNSLLLNFDIAANGWGTCAYFFDSPQNWASSDGLSFFYRPEQMDANFDINLYAGTDENRETYLYTIEIPNTGEWIPVELRWSDFHRASWEENADAPFAKQNEVTGMAVGFTTPPDATNAGVIRVDDIVLLNADSEPNTLTSTQEQEPARTSPMPCSGALIVPLLVVLPVWKRLKKQGE